MINRKSDKLRSHELNKIETKFEIIGHIKKGEFLASAEYLLNCVFNYKGKK